MYRQVDRVVKDTQADLARFLRACDGCQITSISFSKDQGAYIRILVPISRYAQWEAAIKPPPQKPPKRRSRKKGPRTRCPLENA